MRSAPKLPKPIPPATPAVQAVTAGGVPGTFNPATLPGIFTSTAGLIAPPNTQKRAVLGA